MSVERIIMNVIASLAQSISCFVCIGKFVDYKKNKRKNVFFISLIIYYLIVSFFIPNEIRFILFVTVISLLVYFILKEKSKLVVLYSFNSIFLLSISEVLVSLLLVLIGINSTDIVDNMFYNTMANILISTLTIVTVNLPFIKKIISKEISLFTKNKKLINYLYLFLLILYLIVSKNGLEFILKSNYYINILFIVVVIAILYVIIRKELKNEQLNEQNIQMLNHVTKYEKIITEQGKANHEFKNQLMVIRGYAQMNSPKLIEYIDSITDDTKKTHSSYMISQLNKFPEGGIKGLLYYKLSTMEDEKIKYDLDVEAGVKTKLNSLSVVMYKNITKILGVLLDNAIDASKKTKDKKVIISVTKDKSYVVFTISNTYKGKIDLSKIGTGYTNKGKGHGYGLRLVKDIIESTSLFKIENSCDENYYSTKLIIKIGNKKRKSK